MFNIIYRNEMIELEHTVNWNNREERIRWYVETQESCKTSQEIQRSVDIANVNHPNTSHTIMIMNVSMG
jgi:hypothetical protein